MASNAIQPGVPDGSLLDYLVSAATEGERVAPGANVELDELRAFAASEYSGNTAFD